MASTLTVVNSATLSAQGNSLIGKQGAATDTLTTGFSLTGILGQNHQRTGLLATAAIATVYNATTDLPATGKYLHFWADQIVYLQLIGTTGNVVIPIAAYVPFVLAGYNKLLAVGTTTAISGAAEPTTEALQKVIVGNYSGLSCNYTLLIIN